MSVEAGQQQNEAVDLQQQQAQMAAMMAQLSPEQQAQIQEAVGNYGQQLAAQGIPQEHAQSYVWSYYTQCVTALYQQMAAAAAAAAAPAAAAEAAPAATADVAPAAAAAPQGGQVSSAPAAEVAVNGATAEASAVSTSAAQPDAGATAQAAAPEEEQRELTAEEQEAKRLEDEARRKAEEEAEKEEQLQFQKKLDKMDPVLAARFLKQREKQETGEGTIGEVGSAADTKKNLDPVLAKRWNKMQERGEESAVDLIERAQAAQKSYSSTAGANGTSELAKRWKQRGEVQVEKLDEVAEKAGKPWETKKGASELGKLLAKRQNVGEEDAALIESKLEAHTTAMLAKEPKTELDKKLLEQQAKARKMERDNGKEAVANAAERRHLRLKSGGTAVATYGWPEEGADVSRLSWNVVVLEELTVDLEVFAILRPADGGEDAKTTAVVLQKHARGTHFSGSCAPGHDRKILAAVRNTKEANAPERKYVVEKVVFNFSNSFSWFTAKDVELVTVVD